MERFTIHQAEESDDECQLYANNRKKMKILQEMESEEEEEEDEEDLLGEDFKDLINDDSDDNDEIENKKRKINDSDDELHSGLEEEDYDLIEENLGFKVNRKKRFKRLKRITDEESDGEKENEDSAMDRDVIAEQLFVGSEDEEERRSERSHGPLEAEHYDSEASEGDYSDADDFIIDDDGRPITEKKKRRSPIFTNAALQEGQDIFGVDFYYEEFEKMDDDEYEEEEDEEKYASGTRNRKKVSQNKASKSIFEIYEPSDLKRGHFTDLDSEIRNTDMPERMQLRDVPVTSVPEGSNELDEEAEWIYKQAFYKPYVSNQESAGESRQDHRKPPSAIGKIKQALDFMRNQSFEVPFIAYYRKEFVQPELNIKDLWKIYKYDSKWCQLRTRKQNLIALFYNMRYYQMALMKNPDAAIPDSVRVIKDEDLDRLRNVQTNEELKDVHTHFLLYYSHEVPAMQEYTRLKQRERVKKAKYKARGKQLRKQKNAEDESTPNEDDEEEAVPEQETLKQAVRSGSYAMCRKAGLDGLAEKFGLTPEHFAENLRHNYQRHKVNQEPLEPIEVAKTFVGSIFKTPEEVLDAAKLMVATQLAHEPLLRKYVREVFYERAKISIEPTKKGSKEIDENHPCYSMKYIKNKPVRDLSGEQFLRLCIAEKDQLLIIKLSDKIDGITSSNYMEEIKKFYIENYFSKNAQAWNIVRSECVELALGKFVFPDLIREIKTILLQESRDAVLNACCKKLYNWIKVAPYSVTFPDEDDEDWDTSRGMRIMGVAYAPDHSQAAFTALLGADGAVTDYLRLPNILKRKNAWNQKDRLLKEADMLALRHFIGSKKPHVVVIGGESREAQMVQADIKEIVAQLMQEEQFPEIKVEIIDNELAKIYCYSKKGIADFRDYPELLRQAISLARKMRDPLMEYAQLCTPDKEILYLRYHTLQNEIPKEELLENLYLEFVNRTNEVGVDINLAVQQSLTTNLVQFVCGLGPRKGQALIKMLRRNNQRLENRTQLVTVCCMGPKVFLNSTGFIKIDTNCMPETDTYVEVLDGSRIHPESYDWARKMAVDALEYHDEEANVAGALEEILEDPEKLKYLDLETFAALLKKENLNDNSMTLHDIRAEMISRYKDLRVPFRSAKPEELFNMLTKETPETFYIGKMVTASVIGICHKKLQTKQLDQANPVRNADTGLWQCPFCLKNDFTELSEVWSHFDSGSCPGQATGVRLRLDNGLTGFVHIKNLSDKHVKNPEERVQQGQTIHCRIMKIDVKRFSVECTSKSSDLSDYKHYWRPQKDPFYDQEKEDKDMKVEVGTKNITSRQQYVKRGIFHSSFRNISYAEAEKIMEQLGQGEVIVRPSSKGADHLTVTWKVTDKIHQHIDVKERGKENAFSLGKSLWIGNEEFEDLDEIIARHVNPMASNARDLLKFKYYLNTDGGLLHKAEEALKEEQKKNASKIHYFVSAAKNYPGKFLLSYLPKNNCCHEYITVTPVGFRYRQKVFPAFHLVLNYFKSHFQDPIPGSTPGTSRAAMSSLIPNATPSGSAMNIEAIQRVAHNMPSHLLHSLRQVASQTPHYPHTPGGAYTSNNNAYLNASYTPNGQTPFMTPYQTPQTSQTPRYSGSFLQPGSVYSTPGYSSHNHMSNATPRNTPQYINRNHVAKEWGKAARNWANKKP